MTKLCKWGNSLGLRLPAPVALAAGLKNGSQVGVRLLDNGSLLITPRAGAVAATEAETMARVMSTEGKW
jgi:antitoxin component of MazEF toxin-antitoxin module